MSEVVTLNYGKALKEGTRRPGAVPVYGTNGRTGWHDTPLGHGPTVILGRKGMGNLGVEWCDGPFWVIDTAYYTSFRNDVFPRFFYYFTNYVGLNHLKDGTSNPSLSRDTFARQWFPLPPIDEQRSIAAFLAALDDKIELNNRMNETLEKIARAIFRDWFVDFGPSRAKAEGRPAYLVPDTWALFPDGFDDKEMPLGCEQGTIGAEYFLTMGQSPPGETYNEEATGLPFYQGRTDFGFRYPSRRIFCTAPTRIAESDDTLVSVRAPVGDLNMAWEKCCIGRGVAGVRHKSGSRSYTYYALESLAEALREYEHTGTVFGAINKQQFEELKIVSPPIELVTAFENTAGAFDERIRANADGNETLTQIRDLLLPKLMSGEVRLNNGEKTIEDAL
jgi:type I restriction enzyme S subunit